MTIIKYFLKKLQTLNTYAYFTKIRIISHFAYRMDIIISLLSNFILLITTVYIWNTAFSGFTEVKGITKPQIITYTIISILMSSVFRQKVQDTVREKVVGGNIAVDFIKPVNLLLSWFFDDIGSCINSIILNLIPILIFSIVFIQIPIPDNIFSLLFFLISLFLSYIILWCLSAIIGLLSFWILELGNMGVVKDVLVRILSGSFLPLWFFPDWFQNISIYLPFKYIYQVPLSIYIGQIKEGFILYILILQSAWCLVLLFFIFIMWKNAKQKVVVQGG